MYREANALTTEPVSDWSFVWHLNVEPDRVGLIHAPSPGLYFNFKGELQVASLNYEDFKTTSLITVGKIKLKTSIEFFTPCILDLLEVYWGKTQQLPILAQELSVIVPLTLLAQSPKIDLYYRFKYIGSDQFQVVACDITPFLFESKPTGMNDSTIEVTGCIMTSLATLVKAFDYQIIKFKLTQQPASQVFCEFDGNKSTEAYSDGTAYACRVPKIKHTQTEVSVRVLVYDQAASSCPGSFRLKVVD
jgi:hypothetical protein